MDDGGFFFLMILAALGGVVSFAWPILIAFSIAKAVKGQIHQWNALSQSDQLALLRRLRTMAPMQRSGLANDYRPVRDSMASMAASNGIDPSFLY